VKKGPKRLKRSYRSLWKSPTGRLRIGVFGMRPKHISVTYCTGRVQCSYIISTCVGEDIVQCISLGDVLRSLANDNDKFDFIVRYMLLHRLSYLGDDYRGQGSDEGRQGFIEKDWDANLRGSGGSTLLKKRSFHTQV
jgi:hypothetical protein